MNCLCGEIIAGPGCEGAALGEADRNPSPELAGKGGTSLLG